jgi:hypothetical protein
MQAWRGLDPALVPVATAQATATSANPNSGNATVLIPGSLVFSIFGLDDDDATVSVVPTGFTASASANTAQSSTSVGATVAMASRDNVQGGADPSAWTTSSADAWRAITVTFAPLVTGTLRRRNLIATTFGTTSTGHGTGAATTAAFTPSDNSLLVVRVSATQETDGGIEGTSLTIADSLGTLSWTSRVASTSSPGWSYGERVWTAPVTTGTSMTVSADCGASNIHAYRIEVYEYTGYDTTTPVGGIATGTDADGNGVAQITLDATPAATSEVLAFGHVSLSSTGGAGFTPGTNWSELFGNQDASYVDGWCAFQAMQRKGSTDTAVDWADLQTGAAPTTAATLIALEIREAAAAEGVTPEIVEPLPPLPRLDTRFRHLLGDPQLLFPATPAPGAFLPIVPALMRQTRYRRLGVSHNDDYPQTPSIDVGYVHVLPQRNVRRTGRYH